MPLPQENLSSFEIRRVRVTTSGTPVQGPTVTVPNGYALVVRMRRVTSGAPTGYVANSSANTADDTVRSVLNGNDAITMNVTNMNLVWVDADTNTTDFEFIVEQ